MKKKTARTQKPAAKVVRAAKVSKVATQQYSEEMRSFLVHAILYVLVNVGLFMYMYSNSSDLRLFYWVLIGWGVGLVAHAMAVFGIMKYLHKEW